MASNFKIITLRENKSYGWQTFIRVIKCQQAFWPEDDVNHLNHLYTISLQKRKPGLNKNQRLLTLYDFTHPIILYVQLRVYKLPLKIKLRALLKTWSPRVVLSCFLFLLFSSDLPSGHLIGAWGSDYLFAWASKTHSRRHPRWGIFCYSRGRLLPP